MQLSFVPFILFSRPLPEERGFSSGEAGAVTSQVVSVSAHLPSQSFQAVPGAVCSVLLSPHHTRYPCPAARSLRPLPGFHTFQSKLLMPPPAPKHPHVQGRPRNTSSFAMSVASPRTGSCRTCIFWKEKGSVFQTEGGSCEKRNKGNHESDGLSEVKKWRHSKTQGRMESSSILLIPFCLYISELSSLTQHLGHKKPVHIHVLMMPQEESMCCNPMFFEKTIMVMRGNNFEHNS